MKPHYVLQCLTSDKYGRIRTLEPRNVSWILKSSCKFNLNLLTLSYSISLDEIQKISRDNKKSFIIQGGVKKSLINFSPQFEAVVFIYDILAKSYSPKVYRPAGSESKINEF